MASTISPNMGLVIPGIGTEASPTWASDLNASLSSIDSHNHSSGQGVQITPNGMNINAPLAFQGNQATGVGAVVFNNQSSLATVGALYIGPSSGGNELFYNDTTGPVQITSGGLVNATSSGISSGTASAAFSAGVLVVKSSSTSFANIDMQSAVLSNGGNLANQLTLQAPTLSGSYAITLPSIPVSQSFLTVDTSGSISGYAPIANGITRSNLAAVGQQVSSSCGNFTTASDAYVSVTNLSVTITTSGRPVMVMLQADGTNSASSLYTPFAGNTILVQILRGASSVSISYIGASVDTGLIVPPSSILVLDTPSAGTYTYSVNVLATASESIYINNAVLVAYEL